MAVRVGAYWRVMAMRAKRLVEERGVGSRKVTESMLLPRLEGGVEGSGEVSHEARSEENWAVAVKSRPLWRMGVVMVAKESGPEVVVPGEVAGGP